jgi:CO/xanthine dehydrogenase Mo-binding subunit
MLASRPLGSSYIIKHTQAVSLALKEEVRLDEQYVSRLHWAAYPIFRFSVVPAVEVAVIERPNQPGKNYKV